MTTDPFAEYLRPPPAAEELATLLSVAVRIEPELIRAVRLQLTPRHDVSAEADLWFSDWISGRSADSIRLRGELLPGLRDRLARRLAHDRDDPAWRLWEVTAEVHRNISPALLLEEEVTWTAVRAAAGATDPEEIERVLQPALRAVLDHRTGIADWFDAALPRMPATVQRSRVAWQLLQFSPRRSAAPTLAVEDQIELHDVRTLGALVPDALMPIRHDGTQLRLNDRVVTQRHLLLPVPDTRPRVLNLRWSTPQGEREETVRVDPDHSLTLAVPTGSVRIQTGRGLVYELGSHATAEAEDVPTASISVVLEHRASPDLDTPDAIRTAAQDLRERRLLADEELVSAIETEVDSLRAAAAAPQPPPEVAERLPLLGWLLYEASWQALQAIPAEFESLDGEPRRIATAAYELLLRLANIARFLPWPELAPRALGAIRAAALAESKRDTVEGYNAAQELHLEARERHAQFAERSSREPADRLASDEMLIQLVLAEVGTACREAERVISRWPEVIAPGEETDDNEAVWTQRLFICLSDGLSVGEQALDAAARVGEGYGFVDHISPDRLALANSYRNPAIMTARAALLLLALSAEMEHLGQLPGSDESWPEIRARLVESFRDAYRILERPVTNSSGEVLPLRTDHILAVVQLRLTIGLLIPGFELPSALDLDPIAGFDVLDDTAVEALSGWLAEQVDGRQRGTAGILGAATMPAFIRSVEACRAAADANSTYREWRRRWPSLDRYANQPARRALVEQALHDASSTGAETHPRLVPPRRKDPAPAPARAVAYARVPSAVRRALAREDLLRIAAEAYEALGVARQRYSLRRPATGDQEVYQRAFDHYLSLAVGDESWTMRAQAAMCAESLAEFCWLVKETIEGADKAPPLFDLLARSDSNEALDFGSTFSDVTLGAEALLRYRNVRTRRLRGDLGQAIQLADVSARTLLSSGAAPLPDDYWFELGASLLAGGRVDEVTPALAEFEPWTTSYAAQSSNRYRTDLMLGLSSWARGEPAEAQRRLRSAQDGVSRRISPSMDLAELSVTLAAAELAATDASPSGVARALDLGRAALSLVERIPGRYHTVAGVRSPIAVALQRVYGDLALLASALPGEAAAAFGLAVSTSAKQCELAADVRTRSHLLPSPVRALVDDLMAVEANSYLFPEAPSRGALESLRVRSARKVGPTFADLLLPTPVDVSGLRSNLDRRVAIDFVALPDTLDGTRAWFRTGVWPAGVVFERWTPGPHVASLIADPDGFRADADNEWRGLAQELLPGPLTLLLAAATIDQPLDLVISLAGRLDRVPWAALTIGDDDTRLVERAVIALTPTFAHLAGTEPPPVHGPALIQLPGPAELRVPLDRIREAWDLSRTADEHTPLHSHALGTETALTPRSRSLAEELSDGRHQWGFLHIATPDSGDGLHEAVAVRELLNGGAWAVPWPESVLITGTSFDDDANGDLVVALLARGSKSVVLDSSTSAEPVADELSSAIVSVLRTAPTSLHRALRLAQLQLLNRSPTKWAWCSAHVR